MSPGSEQETIQKGSSSRRRRWDGSEVGQTQGIRETSEGTMSTEDWRRGWLVLGGEWPPAWARRERQWAEWGGDLIDGITASWEPM